MRAQGFFTGYVCPIIRLGEIKRIIMAYGILLDYLMGQTIDAFAYFGAHFGTKYNRVSVVFSSMHLGERGYVFSFFLDFV